MEKGISYLVHVPEESKIIKEIYDTYLKVGSIYQTLRYSMGNDITLPNGNYLSPTTIYNILSNPIYAKSSLCFFIKLIFQFFISNSNKKHHEFISEQHGIFTFS